MEKKKTNKISVTNARPLNWYKVFKKREEEAKKKAETEHSSVTD